MKSRIDVVAADIKTKLDELIKVAIDSGYSRIPVYNQNVFTFFISRRFEATCLRILLKRVGIDPYYTFYTKGKDEHRDYVVPIARILQERTEEARLLPGLPRMRKKRPA